MTSHSGSMNGRSTELVSVHLTQAATLITLLKKKSRISSRRLLIFSRLSTATLYLLSSSCPPLSLLSTFSGTGKCWYCPFQLSNLHILRHCRRLKSFIRIRRDHPMQFRRTRRDLVFLQRPRVHSNRNFRSHRSCWTIVLLFIHRH
jgi:hypothetical protein